MKSYTARTDLAVEAKEQFSLTVEDGFEETTFSVRRIRITKARVFSDKAAQLLQKEQGTYLTVAFPDAFSDGEAHRDACECLCKGICDLLPPKRSSVLVVGLGNSQLTADALGPKTVEKLLVTRHLKKHAPHLFSSLRLGEISAISTGVLGQTGIESVDLVKAAVEKANPDAVILIDALAARDMKRLCSTVQITDTGISPGSGVGNKRSPLNKTTLGRPVLSIGIPTVVDAVTVAMDMFRENKENAAPSAYEKNLIVTPKDIDVLIEKSARLLGKALNKALHPSLSEEEAAMLTEGW